MMWITITDYNLVTSKQQFKQAPDNYSRNGTFNDFMFAFLRYEQQLPAQVCSSMAIVSQPNKYLKFMTFREGCFVIRN